MQVGSVDYAALGRRIKEQRKMRHKTQEELAEELWVSVGYISQIERGVTKVSLDTLSKIAGYLDCDLGALVTGVGQDNGAYLAWELTEVLSQMDSKQRKLLLELARVIARGDQKAEHLK